MKAISRELIERKIYMIRGKKIMFDHDLAKLYRVSVKALNQAVKRNNKRFPEDFMFQIRKGETPSRSQFVTLKRGQNIKYLPYVFTEQGVAMLSSVLKSERAIEVNIQIMRTFTKLRELVTTNELIRQKIEELEQKYAKHDKQFEVIFEAIRELISAPNKSKGEIGFHTK